MAMVGQPTVSDTDRFGFTTFLALAFHAAVFLGIGFQIPKPSPSPPSIEVTLATQPSTERPEQADFLAQANQAGSGTETDAVQPTTDLHSPAANPTQHPETAAAQPVVPSPPQPQPRITTERRNQDAVTRIEQPVPPPEPEPEPVEIDPDRLSRSIEIAGLEAELDRQRNLYARRPRVRTINAASTQQALDAAYLNAWRKKVERVGNLNYPAEARRQQIFGNVRLLVALLPDGSVDRVQVLESSGYPMLDQAAVDIVRLAAPFSPFPPELRQEVDVLQIIRTWSFRKNRYSSS